MIDMFMEFGEFLEKQCHFRDEEREEAKVRYVTM